MPSVSPSRESTTTTTENQNVPLTDTPIHRPDAGYMCQWRQSLLENEYGVPVLCVGGVQAEYVKHQAEAVINDIRLAVRFGRITKNAKGKVVVPVLAVWGWNDVDRDGIREEFFHHYRWMWDLPKDLQQIVEVKVFFPNQGEYTDGHQMKRVQSDGQQEVEELIIDAHNATIVDGLIRDARVFPMSWDWAGKGEGPEIEGEWDQGGEEEHEA